MAKNSVPFSLRLPEDLLQAVDKLAEEAGVPRAQIIRWAVERYLENPHQRAPEAPTRGMEVLSRLEALEAAVKALQAAK